MKAFMDKDFMLQSATAQHLYHDYAAGMPICDYHCHIPPREIYENRRFDGNKVNNFFEFFKYFFQFHQ